MLTIKLTFPAGRYHATPWDKQVNEGRVEWPPSPWRLLRAFVAVWHHKLPDVDEAAVRHLIDRLAAAPPPNYFLPASTEAHTRHYMPIGADSKHPGGNTTKAFDTFVALDKESAAFIEWDVSLTDDDTTLLDSLLTGLTYLGRAESWVQAERMASERRDASHHVIQPLDRAASVGDHELLRLLTVDHPDDVSSRSASSQKSSKKKKKDAPPESVFDVLHADTAALRKSGWSRPPGSRWVDYSRPIAKPVFVHASSDESKKDLPKVARFAVHCRALPRLTDAVLYGDAVRKAVMSASQKLEDEGNAHPVFSGKTADGNALAHGHKHAHFLPEADETSSLVAGRRGAGRITHITVFAANGFEDQQRRALAAAARVYGRQGHPLRLVLLGFGSHEQSPLLGTSRIWVSRTPFVPTRHFKKNRPHQEQLRGWIIRELESREWLKDAAAQLESIDEVNSTNLGGKQTRWLAFRRWRNSGGGAKANSSGYGFRLTFREPVQGPIALGYGCHFGLGQFMPESEL